MTPESKTALINAGRLLRLQIVDTAPLRDQARREFDKLDLAISHAQDRLAEIVEALAVEGIELPDIQEYRGDRR